MSPLRPKCRGDGTDATVDTGSDKENHQNLDHSSTMKNDTNFAPSSYFTPLKFDDSASEMRESLGGNRIRYIQHRSSRRYHVDSTTSEFETDPQVQAEQRKKLAGEDETKPRSKFRRVMVGTPLGIVGLVIFVVLSLAGVSIALIIGKSKSDAAHEEAMSLALDTGALFTDQLGRAILPLFSMAQFALHLDSFRSLPSEIKSVGEVGALPLNQTTWTRNVTGICDDPEVTRIFAEIADSITKESRMEGIISNIQLSPQGVVCLTHPPTTVQDNGKVIDHTLIWGMDLFYEPNTKFNVMQSIAKEEVGVAGPMKLRQCLECDPYLIARLPIRDQDNLLFVDGVPYRRWGFVTALIAWTSLVEKSGIYESFKEEGIEFQLKRTDNNLNTETFEYEESKVILAETPNFKNTAGWKIASTELKTTNNEWVMTVAYNQAPINRTVGIVIVCSIFVAFLIALLTYLMLAQKHMHADMMAKGSAQEARVVTERNMTAYFAHELRNPLSALDSALSSISMDELPKATRELLESMQLCSSFMSSIMNNLLDARKIEEGKMRIRNRPLCLSKLLDESHTMMKSAVRKGVEFRVIKDLPAGRRWVLGDKHRIQQVLTNIVTNAIKYTLQGAITLSVRWQDQCVILSCEDTGPGIPKSEQERMFERFVQRGGAPGTGLGLNIAQQIVTIMGGTIRFESDPSVAPGTTCLVSLPLLLCEEHDKPDNGNNEEDSNTAVIEDPLDILIIDDIKMNRTILSRRMRKAIAPNARVVTVETGEKALEICAEKRFDVIICDQYMEEAGGVMVGTDCIIAMRRMKVDAFIVGCSGNDLDAEFYEAGADAVWRKPLPSNAEIIKHIRQGRLDRSIEFSAYNLVIDD